MGGDSSLETRVIEIGEEEREAEHVETTDYFFNKIGESVPLTPNNSSFDLPNPPSLPLAVSERFRLTFVTISDGFCVAKTADVINLAKDIKSGRADASSSVLDVSFVQVLIGRVSILSLSTDSSTLAASVGGDIHFFSVKSLLAKEKEPCLLLSIESPNFVKHISWTKKRDTSFVVLSNTGTLYSGDLKQPLKHVMDDVNTGRHFPISGNQSYGEQLKNSVELDKRLGGGQSGLIGNEFLKQVPLKSFAGNAPKTDAENFKKADNLKLVGRSASDFPVGKDLPISKLSHGEKSKNFMDLGSREPRSNQATIFRDVLEQGTANLSGSFSSSGAMATNSRRATSVPTNASMGIHSTQVPGSLLPGKTVSYVDPVNVKPKSPSPSTLSNFEMSLSKNYGNMKDMTSEMDKLLQCIEEPGGFIDTCTSSQKLLENLEETMADLCHKCTKWQFWQGEYTWKVLSNKLEINAIGISGIDKN